MKVICKILSTAIVCLCLLCSIAGCSSPDYSNTIVTTTTVASDIAKNIAGTRHNVISLMSSGIDPHSYEPTTSDIYKLSNAPVVIYIGNHLEGKMDDIFPTLSSVDKLTVCLTESLDTSELIYDEYQTPDPHYWFNPLLYIKTAKHFCEKLSSFYPQNKDYYYLNLDTYIDSITQAHLYAEQKVATLEVDKRYLVTSHDAFSYLANCYGFCVLSLQGISTNSEVSASVVSNLADTIANLKIKAVFSETSVNDKSITSLLQAVSSRGHSCSVGGELHSDSLGASGSLQESYTGTLIYNIDTIVDALL